MPVPATVAASQPAHLPGLSSAPKLNASGNAAFVLVHYRGGASSWEVEEVDGSPTWLPVLCPYPLVPGVGGVKTLSAGEDEREQYAAALQRIARQDGILLDVNMVVDAAHLPDGVLPGPYLRTMPANGGLYHHLAWDAPRRSLHGSGVDAKHDRAAYNRWRLHLATSGVIPAPSDEVLDDVSGRAEARVLAVRHASKSDPADIREARIGKVTSAAESYAKAARPWIATEKPRPSTQRAGRGASGAAA